ncbi:DUF6695 family protein [Sphingobacterium paludis]|uniref:Uncharacterized protein n=1 Tax=Sphingobacterium paludis TaxID=1476465 RepID=A0A4R7CWC5_9SPHI|nr:DUF6695 family protein [Sphingobacterium paludis]TDS10953.1 hypothetical protein B0I21_10810 [Sphingobacterium paludis]
MYTFDDIAIPISWPDKTARGDEKWMALLKRMGVVKNLNFRVGHAAILLIERKSGKIEYFDFGRYIVPRGYGRSRSARFDPRLRIRTEAKFDSENTMQNLDALLAELVANEEATHGGGRTLFSICRNISFAKGVEYADRLVETGPILYGAFAKNNNSCSRFVAQILTAAMSSQDPRRRKILYPESFKASPTSNVVNAAEAMEVFCHSHGETTLLPMDRKASMRFQFNLLKDNFSKRGALSLGSDDIAGMVQYRERPTEVPEHAQWLGGIGEGAWFALEQTDIHTFLIRKYKADGTLEYFVNAKCVQKFDPNSAYAFTYHFSFENHSVVQNEQFFLFRSVLEKEEELQQQHNRQAIS